MKKGFNVMSKTALAAVFAASAIVAPVVASANTTTQATETIDSIYFEIEGSVYKVSLNDYSEYLIFGNAELAELIGSSPINSVIINGKIISLEEYSEYLIFGGELADLPTVDYTDINNVEVNQDGTIVVTPPAADVDFKVDSIVFVDVESITVELDATPSEAPTAADFSVTVDGVAVEVTDVTEGADETTFVLSVNLFDKAGVLAVNGVEAPEAIDFAITVEDIENALAAVETATDAAELLEALQSPVLGLDAVNPDYAQAYFDYLAAEDLFIGSIEQIQKNLVDAVNAQQEEAGEATLEAITEAVAAYKAATGQVKETAALTALEDALGLELEDNRELTLKLYADFLGSKSAITAEDVTAAHELVEEITGLHADIEAALVAFKAPGADFDETAAAVIETYYAAVDGVDALVAGKAKTSLEKTLNEYKDAILGDLAEAITEATPAEADVLDAEAIADLQEEHDALAALVGALVAGETGTEVSKKDLEDGLKAIQKKINVAQKELDDAAKALVTAVNTEVTALQADATALTAALGNAEVLTSDDTASVVLVFGKAAQADNVTFIEIKEIEAALVQARLVDAVNTSVDRVAALRALKYAPFTNLGTIKGQELALLFSSTVTKNEIVFTTVAEVEGALDLAIALYNSLLADINAATTITEMQAALTAVIASSGAEEEIPVELAEDALIALNLLRAESQQFGSFAEVFGY